MKSKILSLLMMAQLAAAHEEKNAPLLQGFVHLLGVSEEVFVFGGTAVILFLVWLWKRV